MSISKTDILIIGAGPAGSASASILNKKGYDVTIIEKTTFPRFVIGESLLPRCMDLLQEADLLGAVKEKNFQEKFGAKFRRENKSCDFNFSEQFTEGWKWTWQVPREDFDKTLADTVESRGVKIHYNTSVDNVKFSDKNVITTISSENNSSEIHSKYIIDGSGYGRVLPRLLDLDAPSSLPPRAAIFTHIIDNNRPNDVDGNRIQAIVIKKDLWAWVIPFSNGKTSVGIVGDIQNLTDKNKSNEANFKELLKLNKFLKSRIGESSFVFEPRMITAYSSSVKKFNGDRFVLTGNSTEFLDPIFSSGVTFALESGVKAANLVDRELQGKKVDWEKEYVTYIQQGVDVFRSYINDWYNGNLHTVFFSDNIDQNFKEQICSVLAGYVWDHNNPFVKKHKKIIKNLAKVIEITQ